MNDSNKTAVITGISSGIGFALAQKLLNENYYVIGTSRSGKIEGLHHTNLQVISLEATDQDSIQQAISQIPALSNGIDLLINNAGTAPDVFEVNPNMNTFNQTFATNVTGVVFFTEPLLPYLKEGAQVVFISSNMGLPRNADSNGPGYRMSKAAVNMYASILAKRVAERGIRVTPMHPGWVQTKLGGSKAPYTPAQAADALYHGILTNVETGKFWNATINAIEEF
jgi:NAD(P)-dependent dehydrogenase (short-subunit alcohol dehydrogenase family)